MHKICAREVKTTGMETAGNQWGGTNFRKRFINFKKMLAISKKYGIIMIVSFRKWISQAEIAQPVEHFTRNEGVVSSNLIFGLFFRNPQDVRFCGFSGIMRNMTEIRTPFAGKRSAAKGVCCYKFQENQFVQHILTELLARHFKEHISCCHFPVLPPVRRVPGGKRRSRSNSAGTAHTLRTVRWISYIRSFSWNPRAARGYYIPRKVLVRSR